MKPILTALLLVLSAALACADVGPVTQQADALHDAGQYADAKKALLDAAASASGGELAELYWRVARECLEMGDNAEDEKKPQADILALFTEGEGYADKAIAADARNDWGYYWKSANIGRWGQVKGILNSLFKAGPMKDLLVKELGINPERPDAYYVLGQLFREVPGAPMSFGNVDAAVSLGRVSVDYRGRQVQEGKEKELNRGFINELAKTLYKRNWSAAKRLEEQKKKAAKLAAASTPLDKGCLYEASVTLQNVSDREEAKALARQVVADLENASSLTQGQKDDLESARKLLKTW